MADETAGTTGGTAGGSAADTITIRLVADASGVEKGVAEAKKHLSEIADLTSDKTSLKVEGAEEFVGSMQDVIDVASDIGGAAQDIQFFVQSAAALGSSFLYFRDFSQAFVFKDDGSFTEGFQSMKDAMDAIGLATARAAESGTGVHNLAMGLNGLDKAMKRFSDPYSSHDSSPIKDALDGVNKAVDEAGVSENATKVKDLGQGLKALANGLNLFSSVKVDGALGGGDSPLSKAIRSVNRAMTTENVSNIVKNADSVKQAGSALRGVYKGLSLFSDAGGMTAQAENLKGVLKGLNGAFAALPGGAADGAKQAGSALKSLATAIKNLSEVGDIGAVTSQLVGSGGAFSQVNDALKSFEGADKNVVLTFARIGRGLNDFGQALGKLDGKDAELGRVARSLAEFAGSINQEFANGNVDLGQFQRIADALDKVTRAYERLDDAKKETRSKKGKSPLDNMVDSGVQQAFQAMGSAIDKLAGKLASLARTSMGKLVDGAKRYVTLMGKVVTLPLESVKGKIDGIKSKMDGLLSTVSRIVLYRALRAGMSAAIQGITAGIQNLYQWALITGNSFVATMDSMATSMTYFKNSIGAAASELLDALAPALETVINWVVAALNAINQLLAAVTGHGVWRKAVRSQQRFAAATGGSGGAAGGAKKATDAVKEYERTVLGFDELNRMNKPDKSTTPGSGSGGSGGGGGATVPDYGSMFETAPIDDFYKQLANTDDWTALGQRVADAINSWMDGIDWDGIDRTASMWSRRIWTSFNGFIDGLRWDELGYTLGRGLNVALHFVDSLAQNIHFPDLGAGMAAALNQAVRTVDWFALGRVMTDGLKVALGVLHGFMNGSDTYAAFDFGVLRNQLNVAIDAAFGNINWNVAITDVTNALGQVAVTFVSGLNRVIQNINDVVSGYDWIGWGASIGGWLNEAVGHIDWGAVGTFLSNGLKIAFDFLHGFVETFDFASLGEGIKTALRTAFAEIDWARAGTDLNKLANDILGLIEGAFDGVSWDDLGEFLKNLNIPQLLQRALNDIMKLLGDALGTAAEGNLLPLIGGWIALKLGGWFLNNLPLLLASPLGDGIVGTAGSIADGIGGAVAGAAAMVGLPVAALVAIGAAIIGTIALGSMDEDSWNELRDNLKNGVKGIFTDLIPNLNFNIGELLGTLVGSLIQGIPRLLDAGVQLIDGLFQGINDFDLIGAIGKFFEGFLQGFTSAFNLDDAENDWVNLGKDIVGGILDGIKAFDFLSPFGQWIDGFIDFIKEKLGIASPSTVMRDEVGTFIPSGILEGIQGGWPDLTGWLGQAVDDLKGIGEGAGEAIKGGLDGLGSWFDENVGKPVGDTLSQVGTDVSNWASDRKKDFDDWTGDTGQKVSDWASDTKSNFDTWAENTRQTVSDWATKASGSWETFKNNASTSWGNAKRAFTDKLATPLSQGVGNLVRNATNWGSGIGNNLGSAMSATRGFVGNAVGRVKNAVSDTLGRMGSTARGWGSDIGDRFGGAISAARSYVMSASGVIASAVSSGGGLSSMWRSARTWGSDIGNSLASGMRRAMGTVRDAASALASKIASFIHFSEPDVGPLSDFHTYMPDMMRSMALGISSNRHLVTDALDGLTSDMSSSLAVSPSLSLTAPHGDLGSVVASAVERAVVSVQMGQSSRSEDQREIVLRVDSQELARAAFRGADGLSQRGIKLVFA